MQDITEKILTFINVIQSLYDGWIDWNYVKTEGIFNLFVSNLEHSFTQIDGVTRASTVACSYAS